MDDRYDVLQLNEINKAKKDGYDLSFIPSSYPAEYFKAYMEIVKYLKEKEADEILDIIDDRIKSKKDFSCFKQYMKSIKLGFANAKAIFSLYDLGYADYIPEILKSKNKDNLKYLTTIIEKGGTVLPYLDKDLKIIETICYLDEEVRKAFNFYIEKDSYMELHFLKENVFPNWEPSYIDKDYINPDFDIYNLRLINFAKENKLNVSKISKVSASRAAALLQFLEKSSDIKACRQMINRSLDEVNFPDALFNGCIIEGTNIEDTKYALKFLESHTEEEFLSVFQVLASKFLNDKYFNLLDKNISFYNLREKHMLNNLFLNLTHGYNKELIEHIDFSSLFDIKFSDYQKEALINKFNELYDAQDCILNYIKDELYTPEQISFLAGKLLQHIDITPALSPSFSIEHMEHILFYTSRGIFFKSDKDYDKNYIQDKNKSLEDFVMMYKDLSLVKNYKVDTIENLININKEYNFTLNISEIVDLVSHLDKIFYENFDFCVENNIDMGLYYSPKFNASQLKIIREAILNNQDYKSIMDDSLTSKQMKQILEGGKQHER